MQPESLSISVFYYTNKMHHITCFGYHKQSKYCGKGSAGFKKKWMETEWLHSNVTE